VQAAVGGPIVDDEKFKVAECLIQDAFDGGAKEVFAIKNWHEDGNTRSIHGAHLM
jgi:hypothetical protein